MSDIVEYKPGTPFPGVIGRTLDESSSAWPEPTRAREGAPNVIFFVLDDVGYGQLSPFGGLVNTPTLDKLAQGGLRYTNFHTTALCSPTRGCVLTGRNHHTLGLSAITEISIGYPAHNPPLFKLGGTQYGISPPLFCSTKLACMPITPDYNSETEKEHLKSTNLCPLIY